MRQWLRGFRAIAIAFIPAILTGGAALAQEPLRVGLITFLSGPAAGLFGVPAKNAADLLAEALNQGGQIPGYGVDGKVTLVNVKYYPPELVSPPDGMKSVDWIRSGFK